ncbi:MAG: DegT/DnrJ/EryC1/StrS family aminotransferase [Planctomycetes bacterium]|nr:DegT/DnrJ/EryC1/StrS family aminotransferase [Planctomycetota bacterium]
MRVPFVDLKAQYDAIKTEIDAAVASVIRESAFIGGPYLKAFEKDFAAYCGSKHALGVSNGTDALRLALLACGVGPGDDVITVPNTFIATAEAVSMTGASVRFVDVEEGSLNMDPGRLAAAITSRTRCIIPVHLYGRPADMDPVLDIARKAGLKVVADAAQAHGARYKGRGIARLGDAVCFSFYPGKNLGAYGDAGAVATDDPAIAEKVALLRDHGRLEKYEHRIEGFNCRMDGLQAAVLSVKLRSLEAWTEARRRIAGLYGSLLEGAPGLTLPPAEDRDSRSVYHLYVVRTDAREELRGHLAEAGVATGIHYPIPLHRQPAYARLGLPEGSFPAAEASARRILSLPMFPELTEEQTLHVCSEVRRCLERSRARSSVAVP